MCGVTKSLHVASKQKNLNIEMNHVYHFKHLKMKPAKGNSNYPGQDRYEIHLTPISTIVDVTI